MYRPYKFLIVPVIQEVDDDGNVVRELNQEEPSVIFGVTALRLFAELFESTLNENVETAGGNGVRQRPDQPRAGGIPADEDPAGVPGRARRRSR